MMISFIFPEIPVSKVAVLASHRNGCFLFFLSLLGSQWTGEHDILLSREVLGLEVDIHKKGTNEAGRLWDEIGKSLRGCQNCEN